MIQLFRRRSLVLTKQQAVIADLWPVAIRLVIVASLAAASMGFARSADASTSVQFDTACVVSCRDVTTEEFAKENPRQRLVSATFRISALLDSQRSADRLQYVYHIVSPFGNVQIVDYEPKNSMDTRFAGNITHETKTESNKSLGVSLSGSFEQLVRGTVGSDLGTKETSSVKYDLKPPLEVVSASGTVQRGTGVYFKLWPSSSSSLEGSRDFALVMRVPAGWRGDVMYVRCEALEQRQDDMIPRGETRFVVALHAHGDDVVRVAAQELNRAETVLRRTVANRERDIRRRSVPSLVHHLGAVLDVYDPKIPDSWLDRLIYGPTDIESHEFARYLPEDVRRVASRFGQAKRKLHQYSGGRGTDSETQLSLR